MKILLFGKTRGVNRLPEDMAADLRLSGHEVRIFPYRNTKIKKILEPLLLSRRLGVPLATMMARATRLFGPDWDNRTGLAPHLYDRRRISGPQLTDLYRSHIGVLNIRNEQNVIRGLNQRHFAPYIVETPVVSDLLGDIEHCFDPGKEILVYRDAAELNQMLVHLRTDPARAQAIGLAGRRRVLAQHTYTHRVEAMALLAGIRPGRTGSPR